MSNTPHELAEDFPEHIEVMHELRASDAHFAKLYDAYHVANRAVHRAETDVEPTSDAHLTELRRERMQLKDQIYGLLTKAQTQA
ncbi:YdcH family protein [Gymnodinialimonas sp.]